MVLLTDRYALITGASSGIGKATALAFAQAGFPLALLSRSQEKLEAVAAEAREFGVKVKVYPFDLTQLELIQPQIQAIAQDIVQASGQLAILVNNAGMGYTGTLGETPLSDWQRVIDLNLTSVFQCIQGVLPAMRHQQAGLIINVASIAAHQVFPGWGAYCVSKFGLLALSRTLATEERSHGLRVTTLCPGSVNTPLWDSETVQADFDRQAMLTPEAVAQAILHIALLPAASVIEELTLISNAGTF